MTNKQHTLKRNRSRLLTLCFGLLGLVFMASCNKNDDTYVQQDVSGIKFIHALPATTSLDFYVGGRMASSSALLYSQSTSYLGINSGTYVVQVGLGGTSKELEKDTVTFEPDKGYSYFVTGKSTSLDTATSLIIKDDLTAPSAGKAKVRFVNLSKAEGSLDLAVENGTGLLATGKAFRAYSEFVEIDPASYVFQAKAAGTSDVKAFSASTSITAGKIYTVWAKGIAGGTGDNTPAVYVIAN